MELTQLLERLCALDGISGDETVAAEFICSQLDGKCEYSADALGNIIAFKKGEKSSGKKLMLCAHMDEVGLIVTNINKDGTLSFGTVGGVDSNVLFGKRVYVSKERHLGVIASKTVHNLSKDEKKKALSTDELVIDLGMSEEQAKKCVNLGDSVVFDSQFLRFGNGMLKGKAIDDRAGCAILLMLLENELKYDTYFVFTVQEEVGLRGASAATFAIKPDFAVVIEATTAADIPSSNGAKRVCEVGKGAVVSYMDRRTIYDKELYSLAWETAEECNLPCQTKTMVAGGNDAGTISVTASGVRTAAISLPCRYLHTPSSVISESDLISTYELVKHFAERIHLL
ncbi:MAG: M20/M25/M40 family metallo-hydrolase [Ruminococcus sp.]|nr:M20/M25/M40 family metallo-hydrolase [Ruminococcus sp.]